MPVGLWGASAFCMVGPSPSPCIPRSLRSRPFRNAKGAVTIVVSSAGPAPPRAYPARCSRAPFAVRKGQRGIAILFLRSREGRLLSGICQIQEPGSNALHGTCETIRRKSNGPFGNILGQDDWTVTALSVNT